MATGFRILLRAACALTFLVLPAPAGAQDAIARYDELLARWDDGGLARLAAEPGPAGMKELAAAAAAFLRFDPTAPALAAVAVEAASEETRSRAEWLRDTVASWHALLGGFFPQPVSSRVRLLLPASHREWGKLAAPFCAEIVDPVLELFQVAADGPVVEAVFLENLDQLAVVSRVPVARLERSGTVGMTLFGRVFLLSPASFPEGYAWHVVLGHEAVHHALRRRVPGRLPHFYEEGIASLLEEWGRTGKLKELLPLEKALLQLADDKGLLLDRAVLDAPYWQIEGGLQARLAFVQARLAAALLLQKAQVESLRQLLDGLADGTPFDELQRTLTGVSPDAFFARVKARWRSAASRENLLTLQYDSGPDYLPEKARKAADEAASLVTLGDLLWGRGRIAAALAVYMRLPPELQVTPDVSWRICRLLVDLGRTAEARTRIRGPLELFPSDSRVLYAAALVARAAGDAELAGRLARDAWLVNPFSKETADAIMTPRPWQGDETWVK
ncbi:MAG: hypothetical protein FJ109_04295 [Deltaproteobacteria bacterium]|nr:hypothetical protein [Deltaproteobacteria bacterium]